MSNVMDRKVVEMQFDNAQFEKGVKTSISTLDKLKESLEFEGVDKGFENIERSSSKIDFSGMRDSIDTITYKFSAFEAMALGALMRIGERAVDAGIKLAKSMSVDNVAAGWSKYEDKTRSVGTLIAQGFDLSTVNEQLDRLNWYTDETSYSFTNMVAEIAKFTATGKGLEESVDALMGIANWAALSGQNASTASRAMYQLSQAMGAGVLRKEDYKSIQNVSMDTAEFRQKALDAGVALGTLKKNADGTYQSIVKGAKSSKFDISQFAEHLTQDAWFTSDVMMTVYRDYGNAIDKIYKYAEDNDITASQAIKELGDELDEFGVKAFKAAQEARSWNDTVESVKEAVASGFMQTFEIIFGEYDKAVDLWTDLANRFYDVFAQPINNFNSMLKTGLQEHSEYVSEYLTNTYGVAEGSIENVAEVIKKFGIGSAEANKALAEVSSGNKDLEKLISNYIQLFKLGDDGSKVIRTSSNSIIEYTSSVTKASKEDIAALKEIGDKYGYESSKYKSQMKKVFGKGKDDIYETATALLAVTDGLTLIESKDIDSYLIDTIKMTDEQVQKLHELAFEYGASSKEVDEYLKSLDNLKGFGNSKNLDGVRKSIVGILEVSDTAWRSGDIVSYISNLTGASEESVKILKDLIDTKKELISTKEELESAELDDSEAVEKNTRAREKNSEKIKKNQEDIDRFIDEISNGDEALKNEILGLIELNDELDSMTGYRNILQSFINVWDYLSEVIGHVKDAFDDLFPSLSSEQIYNFTVRLKNATENLKLSEESIDRLKRAAKGFFSIFRIIGQAVGPVILPIKAFISELKGDGEAIFEGVASIGDWITGLADSGKVAQVSQKIFGRFADVVKVVVRNFKSFFDIEKIIQTYNESGGGFVGVFSVINEKIKDAINGIADFIAAIAGLDPTEFKKKVDAVFERIKNAFIRIKDFFTTIFGGDSSEKEITRPFEKIKDIIDKIKEGLGTFIGGIKNVFSKVKEAVKQSKLAETLHNIWEKIKQIASSLGEFLAKALEKIGEKLNNIEVEDVLSFLDRLINLIGLIIGGAATLELIDFVEWIKDIPSLFKDSVSGFASFFEGVGDTLDAFRKRIQVKTVRDIGIALLLIAVALVAIASIPADKLDTAVFAMGNLAGVLVGVLASIKGLSDGSLQKASKTRFDSSVFLKLAASLLIIAFAIKQFKDMDEGQIKTAVGAIIALMAGMVAVIEILGKTEKLKASNITKSMTGMILMGVALRIVVSSIKSLAKLDPDGLKRGMIATVALMAMMVIASGIMSKFDKPGKVITASSGMIVFAVALRLVIWSVKALAKMDPENIKKGIMGIIPLIALMVLASGIMSKFDKPGKVITASVGLIAFAAALRIIVASVKSLADVTPKNLKKSIIGVTILIGEMLAAAGILSMFEKPGKVITSALGLILFAAALKIVVSSVKDLADMTGPGLKKGLLAITVLITELVAAAAILAQFSGGKSIMGAAGVMAMVLALMLLVPVMKTIATMSWGDILKALAAFAAVITIIVVAGYALKKVSKSLLSGAAAMALFGAAVALVGLGLQLIAGSLGALGTGIKLFFAGIGGSIGIIVTVIKSTLTGLIELIPIFMTKLGEGLMGFLEIVAANEDTMKNAFLAILRASLSAISEGTPEIIEKLIDLIIGVLDKLNERLPELIDKVALLIVNAINGLSRNLPELIKAGFDFVKSLIEGVIAALADFKIDNVDDLNKAVENLLGIMLMLGAMSVIFPLALAGVLGLGTIAVALTGVVAALGAISKIQGVSYLVSSGGDLLGEIGTAIGKFIGGLVGEIMVGVASQLPAIAAALSAFAMHAVPFIAIMKMVDSDVLEGAGRLAGALLAITAADILTQIAGFFGADVSFETLGDKLENLGDAMVRFAESTSGLNPEAFDRVVDAASRLVDLARSLPSTEGLWGWIAGKQDLGEFGDKLAQLATGLVSFAEAARGISEEDCTAMKNVADALDPIVDLSRKLPNTEGAWGWIAGKQDLGEFGDKLGDLATGLTSFAEASRGISEEDCTAMKNVADALDPIVDLSHKLPNTEGAWGWISGKQDLGEFGTKLGDLATGMSSFADAAANVSEDDIMHMKSFVGAVDPIVDIANKLPNTEGAWGWLSGKADLGDFGKNLKSFGEGVSGFAENTRGISSDDITKMTDLKTPVDSLADMAARMDSISDVKKLKTFSGTLEGFAKDVKSFVNAWSKDVDSSKLETAITGAGNLVTFANQTVNADSLTSLASGINALAGASVSGFISEFEGSGDRITSTISSFLKSAVSVLRDKYRSFYEAGSYLIQGLINGMRSKEKPVEDVAVGIVRRANEAMRNEAKINSPSKVTTQFGRYWGLGFVNGMSEFVEVAGTTATEMGENALNGLRNTLSNPFETNDFDNTITIKPVIDLSEIQNGMGQIDGMLGGLNGYAIDGSMSLTRSTADSMMRRGSSDDVNGFDKVTKAVENLGDKLEKPIEQNNNFNFYGVTPDEMIREVKRTLTKDILKEGRRWA